MRSGDLPAPVAKKAFGQHFLVDDNILGVIDRLARLGPADVVLEIGPGPGVLTAFLAERVARVHAVEIDRSLEATLLDRIGGAGNVVVHWGDALQLDLPSLAPDATKLVANLPYNVATPVVVESLGRLPAVSTWCVMVQREVADRFFAGPRTKQYGAVSVLIQLCCERTGWHPVARTVFRPIPNVDSALVAFVRKPGPERFAEVKKVVAGAFGHRRKTLANALQLAGIASRADAVDALAAIDRSADVRAEALQPHEFVQLERELRSRGGRV